MRTGGGVLLAAAVAMLFTGPAFAQSPAVGEPQTTQSAPAKKPKRAKPAAKAAKAPEPLPCARAKWKDDPVCFGENDPAALPMPSAQSGGSTTPSRSEDVSIAPKVRVNQDTPEPFYGNNPNPNPRGTEFGGGLGLNFHF